MDSLLSLDSVVRSELSGRQRLFRYAVGRHIPYILTGTERSLERVLRDISSRLFYQSLAIRFAAIAGSRELLLRKPDS
jgi:hypothetical protein